MPRRGPGSSLWGERLGLAAVLLVLALLAPWPGQGGLSLEGPGLLVPAGGRVALPLPRPPETWSRAELRLLCPPGQGCAGLRASNGGGGTGQAPVSQEPGWADYRLARPAGGAWALELYNPTSQAVEVAGCRLRDFLLINSRPPRLAVLLGPAGEGPEERWPALLAALGVGGLLILGLAGWGARGGGLWPRAACLAGPGLALLLALGLRLDGLRLALGWETILALGLPGAVLALLRWPLAATCTALAGVFGLLLANVLGVGIPPRWFGPELIYQPAYVFSAWGAAAAYGALALILFRLRPRWFSPAGHPWLASLWLVLLPCLILYLANGYTVFGGDVTFNGWLPYRLLHGQGLAFDQAFVDRNGEWGLLATPGGRLPTFPLGPALLALPAAAVQWLFQAGPDYLAAAWGQKVTAAWVAALAAAALFQAVFLVTRRLGPSLLICAGFALGTSQVTIAAATLWQHGPAVLCLCLGLWCLVKGQEEQDSAWLALAGLPLAFLPVMRTQAVLFYLAGLANLLVLAPRRLPRFILWSLPGAGLALALNLGLYHSLLGGYAYQASGDNFSTPLLPGLAGTLFSPNRGLFLLSPFLALGALGWLAACRRQPGLLLPWALAGAAFLLLHAKWEQWHGGWAIGYRFTSELTPLLALGCAYWWAARPGRLARGLLTALVGLALFINLPGSFYPHQQLQWNIFPNVDRNISARAWDWGDWLPLHFRHFLGLQQQRPEPAYAFVYNERLEPLPDARLHFRVGVPLGEEPVETLKVTNLRLSRGAYRLLVRGDSREAAQGRAELVLNVIDQQARQDRQAVEPREDWELAYDFAMGRDGPLDLSLSLSGQGRIILDTIQIAPRPR